METEQERILRELRTKYRFSRPEGDIVNRAIESFRSLRNTPMIRSILEPVRDGDAIAVDIVAMVEGTYWVGFSPPPPAAAPPPPAAAPPTKLVEEDECIIYTCLLTQQQIDYWKGVALKDIREGNIDGALNIAKWFESNGCKDVAERIRELAGEPEEEEEVPAAAPPPPAPARPAPQTLEEYVGIQKKETAVPEPPAEEEQKTLEQYLNGGNK